MPYGTILDSGYFLGTGSTVNLPLVQGASWLKVYNYTAAGRNPGIANDGLEFNWFKGMPANECIVNFRHDPVTATTSTALTLGVGGVTFIDSSIITVLPNTVTNALITNISAAMPAVVTSTLAWGTPLANGDIVRIYNAVGASQLGAIDFTVGAVAANTRFTLAYMAAIAVAAAPGATCIWRKIPYDADFYPVHRYISKVASWPTNTNYSIITMTVNHGYLVGQQVRFMVPPIYGMTELNGQQASIVAIGQADADGITNTIVVDIPVTSFTPFVFPLDADTPFTPAMVVPIGANTATALSQVPPVSDITDATRNTGMRMLSLGAGQQSPAGAASDLMYWVIGTSWNE
jgi:hypothetical protein